MKQMCPACKGRRTDGNGRTCQACQGVGEIDSRKESVNTSYRMPEAAKSKPS